jgi:2-keto-4-pentenoate hydratase/2-oxohepta-3-ene-1,7-dioic acid hydratase in catechol pathway
MGPWIVTADEVNGADLSLSCRVNGEVRQRATTADLIFDIPTLIETISKSVTLSRGDIIATGPPRHVVYDRVAKDMGHGLVLRYGAAASADHDGQLRFIVDGLGETGPEWDDVARSGNGARRLVKMIG